jgi:hypothetical protein
MKDFWVKRVQLDAFWLYVGNKGEKSFAETPESGQFMGSTVVDMDSFLRVACAIERRKASSTGVFEMLKRGGHPDGLPSTISDGWGGIEQAMIAVYGLVPEDGGVDIHPHIRKPVQPGCTCKWSSNAISVVILPEQNSRLFLEAWKT